MRNQIWRPIEDKIYRKILSQDLSILNWCGEAWIKLAQLFLKHEKKSYEDKETRNLRKIQEFNESIREKIMKWKIDEVLKKFYHQELDSKTADMLSEVWYCERVRENKHWFISLGNVTFDKLIESGKVEEILGKTNLHWDYFGGINSFEDHNYIVDFLINNSDQFGLSYANSFLNYFRLLNDEIYKKLWPSNILSKEKNGKEKEIKYVFVWLGKQSLEETLKALTPSNVIWLKNIMNRFDLDKESFFYMRNKYLEYKKLNYRTYSDVEQIKEAIIENIELFKWLDVEAAELLINNGYWHIVAQHHEIFWLKKV